MKKTTKTNLRDLLIQKINALYDIEQTLVKALPKMATAAKDKDLKEGFKAHLVETKNHVKRLEQASKILGVKPKALKSEAIRGLVKDGEWVIKNVKPTNAMNANLARAAEYVEHYEMAGYIAAIDWATTLEEMDVVDLLTATLQEEQAADDTLRTVGNELDKVIA
ncbi:MAG: DUF892 family protein [Patescibacteria group bacterium]